MSIDEHVEALRAERDQVLARLREARAASRDLEGQVERLESAITALSGKGASTRTRKPRGVSKADVLAEIHTVFSEIGRALTEDELQEGVGERLRAKGRALTGFPLRFRQVIAQARSEGAAFCQQLRERGADSPPQKL